MTLHREEHPTTQFSKKLLNHFVLADDHTLQLLLHENPMLTELLQNIAKTSLFSRHFISVCGLPTEMKRRANRRCSRYPIPADHSSIDLYPIVDVASSVGNVAKVAIKIRNGPDNRRSLGEAANLNDQRRPLNPA